MVVESFFRNARNLSDRPFINILKDEGMEHVSWRAAGRAVSQLAAGLIRKGINAGDRIAIISENRAEWIIADLAIMSLRAISVLIPSRGLSPEDIMARLDDSGARLVLVSGQCLNSLHHVCRRYAAETVCFDDTGYSSLFEEAGLQSEVGCLSQDDVSTIIYTSGTTGSPHGVVLTYGNYQSICDKHSSLGIFPDGYSTLCCIPLAHCLMHSYLFHVIEKGGSLAMMNPGENACGSMMSLERDMLQARPEVLILVPSLLYGLSQLLKIRKIEGDPEAVSAFFGGKLKFMVTGGAAIDKNVVAEFSRIGIPVYPGYGMTETSGGITINLHPSEHPDSIGKSTGGVNDVKILDGEIIYRGANLMKGYWADEKLTSEVIDSNGWYHTGDLGHFDDEGNLYFDGRLKNLLVSVSGEKYDPEGIEASFRSISPLIGQMMVFNQESPYTVALVVPSDGGKELTEGYLESLSSMFLKGGSLNGKYPEIWIPRRFLVLGEAFTVENGLLTAKGSLARHKIYLRWKKEIESLFE